MVGKRSALHAYKYCRKAIYDLQQICKKLPDETGFRIRPSLQYASEPRHKHILYREYGYRLKSGFRVNWLDEAEVEGLFGFRAPGALYSEDAAEVDPYLLTHGLLKYVQQKQYTIYDDTTVTSIKHENNRVILETSTGFRVKAKNVIVACGYESQDFLPRRVAELYSTYALVSAPLQQEQLWYQNCMIWETATPYMYMRTTPDRRVLIGGRDDAFTTTTARDNRIKSKTTKLLQDFRQKFPNLDVRPDLTWAGTFAATKDGLPYIGTVPELPHTYFALGFGGNGVIFSVIAGQLIRDMIKGKTPADSEIFAFTR
jgi:glycine/D-amino acid oxidase-like deaminating enzyme